MKTKTLEILVIPLSIIGNCLLFGTEIGRCIFGILLFCGFILTVWHNNKNYDKWEDEQWLIHNAPRNEDGEICWEQRYRK